MTPLLRSVGNGANFSIPFISKTDWQDLWSLISLQFGRDRIKLFSLTEEFNSIRRDDLMGVVVMRHGQLIYEHYFNETGIATLHNVCSVAKSVTALLVGAAIDRKIIGSEYDLIGDYLPDLPEDKRTIRFVDLLTMRAGFSDSCSTVSQMSYSNDLEEASDWKAFIHTAPMREVPGTVYEYGSGPALLTGMALEKAAERPLDVLIMEWILRPLGSTRFSWRDEVHECAPGHGRLRLTARCMASIGQMVVSNGRYRLRKVLSSRWIRACLTGWVAVGDIEPYANTFGYLWFSKSVDVRGRREAVYFASGNGGNRIYVVPALNLSIAVASHAYDQRYGYERSEAILSLVIDRLVKRGFGPEARHYFNQIRRKQCHHKIT
jgi:CubicO group peptidase (beta-lactamase class C family)